MAKKFFSGLFLIFIVLLSLAFLWISKNRQAPILMYHEVMPGEELTMNVITTDSFRRQMEFLRERRYKVLSFDDMIDAFEDGKKLSRRSVVLTFDDGMENLYYHAFPILKEFKFPAIIFMPSGRVGEEGFLTWVQMREMVDSGLITFGSHTNDNVYLPNLSRSDQEFQIVESRAVLEKNLEQDVLYFAYPTGGFTPDTKDLLIHHGYRAAVTTNRGFDRNQQDLYELKRVSMRDHDHLWYRMWVKSSGYYNIFRKSVKPY
jgi:peptidoglycan/xylan/chitin deacetylase (PgdA/CDA1 family)